MRTPSRKSASPWVCEPVSRSASRCQAESPGAPKVKDAEVSGGAGSCAEHGAAPSAAAITTARQNGNRRINPGGSCME